MLDLNLEILSTPNEDNDFQVPTSMFDQQHDSIDLSNNKVSLINFGILKIKEDVELLPPPPPPPPLPDSELSGESEWLKLSSMQKNNHGMLVPMKKIRNRRGPRSRSSHYRGVTFYRRTGRWESHIWDCGKQVYLGGFESAHTAARAYDRAAIRFRGLQADINFIVDDYKHDIQKMKNLSKEEVVQTLRRECASSRRGSSKYNHFTLQNQTHHVNYDHIHLFQNRRLNAEAATCNEMRKIGAYDKGNEHNNLELSLGISSSSEDIRSKTSDYLMAAVLADQSWVTSYKAPFQSTPWTLSL